MVRDRCIRNLLLGLMVCVLTCFSQVMQAKAARPPGQEDREKQGITLQYYKESEIDDKTATPQKNAVKFSIVLLNEDGTVSYELPENVVVPDSYTYQINHLPMTAATFAQMGLSIPGYTLDNGWAFFWWTGNYSGSMYKVTDFANFGRVSDNYPNYKSYLGFQGLYGNNPGGTGSQSAYESYVNTEFESRSNGRDYGSLGESGRGYYAYNPTGTLRIVFRQVSDATTYKANFVDAFGENQEAGSYVQFAQTALNMHRVENSWNQSTNSYEWYGTLATLPEEQPDATRHEGYTFMGWYTEKDAYGNGCGTRIQLPEDDEREHRADVNYYAKWEPVEEPKPPLEELPNTGGWEPWGYVLAGGMGILAAGIKRFRKETCV